LLPEMKSSMIWSDDGVLVLDLGIGKNVPVLIVLEFITLSSLVILLE